MQKLKMPVKDVAQWTPVWSPYNPLHQHANEMPTYQQRIKDVSDIGRINVIVLDGKAQVGKSTLGRFICEQRDPKYKTLWTIQGWVDYLETLKEPWEKKQFDKIFGKWILFEEPQLEAPRNKFWSERNFIINSITSSYGFLKQNLVMTLPSIYGIQETTLVNISLRISVDAKRRSGKVVRHGYVKIPKYNETRRRYMWTYVEVFPIPELETPEGYMEEKGNNFFNVQLPKWKASLNPSAKKEMSAEEKQLRFDIGSGLLKGQAYKDGLARLKELQNK